MDVGDSATGEHAQREGKASPVADAAGTHGGPGPRTRRFGHAHTHAGHGHGHGHGHAANPTRALVITLTLTLGYFVVEVVMGLISGSLSLLADAGHMLTDGGALALSLLVARIAERPRSASMTYGYRRAEILGALINASTMLVLSLVIVFEAVKRLHTPPVVEPHGLMYTALGGLAVNLVAGLVLWRGGGDSLNVRSALLHVMGDALGSLAALAAGASIAWFGFAMADPLASLLIACVLLVGSVRLLRAATHVLMESTPPDLDVRALERTILETPGVAAVHDLHAWCVTPASPMLTAHVVLTTAAHGTDVAQRVGERLLAIHQLEHVTIQPESPAPELVSLRLPQVKKKP